MAITTEQIKAFREKTGISVMQCRKVLEEANGDFDKAIILLRKKGSDAAAKKAERTLKAGRIASYIHGIGSAGAMVELSCETDFVSKNEEFQKLAYEIAMQIVATNPTYAKKDDVNEEEKKKVLAVLEEEVKGKPEAMKEKILAGKLDAFFKEKILMEQDYIKDPSVTIKSLIENATNKFGEKIEIGRYVRFVVGK